MSVNDLVLVQGMHDTRLALEAWKRDPNRVLRPWLWLSLAVAAGLLLAVYVVARMLTPDPSDVFLSASGHSAGLRDYLDILFRNSLVLALHAFACVAGFMAGSSLPLAASKRSGASRWVHDKAGPLAIVFVVGATTFSLCTQAYAIGGNAADIAASMGIGPATLIVGILPHAVPELVALFLPLAAWMIASRQGRWDELLAATGVTVAIAVPILLVGAAIELWVSPYVLAALADRAL